MELIDQVEQTCAEVTDVDSALKAWKLVGQALGAYGGCPMDKPWSQAKDYPLPPEATAEFTGGTDKSVWRTPQARLLGATRVLMMVAARTSPNRFQRGAPLWETAKPVLLRMQWWITGEEA